MKRHSLAQSFSCVAAVAALAACTAHAATPYTWNGSSSNAWETGANWTPSGVPGAVAGDSVTITTGAVTLASTPAYALASLSITGQTLTISSTFTLTVTSTTLGGGSVIAGAGTFASPAGATITSGSSGSNIISCVFTNLGDITVSSGDLTLSGGGTTNTGTIDASASGASLTIGGGTFAVNGGTLKGAFNVNGGTLQFAVAFAMTGAINLSSGGSGGTLSTATSGSLNLNGTLTSGSNGTVSLPTTVTGLTLAGASPSLALNSSVVCNGTAQVPYGSTLTIASAQTLTPTTMNLGGTISGAGTLSIPAGGSLSSSNSFGSNTISPALTNLGNITVSSGGLTVSGGGSTNTGTIDASAAGTSFTVGGSIFTVNGGTLKGAFNVNNSTLRLATAFSITGSIALNSSTSGAFIDTVSGGSLNLTGALTALGGSSMALSLPATVTGLNMVGGTLTLNSSVTCNGTTQVQSGTTLTVATGATLTATTTVLSGGGSGQAHIAGSGTLSIPAGGSLTSSYSGGTNNIDCVVNNLGNITVNTGNLWFGGGGSTNTGTIDASASGTSVVIRNNNTFFTVNGGVLKGHFVVQNYSTLRIATALSMTGEIDVGTWYSGTIDTASGGSLNLNGLLYACENSGSAYVNLPTTVTSLYIDPGNPSFYANDNLTCNGTAQINGSVTVANGKTFTATTTNLSGPTIGGSGTFSIPTSGSLNGYGIISIALTNLGDITVTSGQALQINGGGTTGTGTIDASAGGSNVYVQNALFTVNGGTLKGSFFINNGATLRFATAFSMTGTLEVSTGAATIDTASGGSLDLTGSLQFVSLGGVYTVGLPITVNGLFVLGRGSVLSLNSNLICNGTTQIYNGGTNLSIAAGQTFTTSITTSVWDSASISGSGTFSVPSGGTLYCTTGGPTLHINPTIFNNAGTVISQSNTLDVGMGYVQSDGSLVLAGGNIHSNGVLTLNGGSLTGSGTVDASVINNGASLSPGTTTSAGVLTLTGTYSQGPTSALNLKLGGTGAGAFDTLSVTGAVTLAGTLNVSLINSFSPAPGTRFDVLSYQSLSGAFGTLTNPFFSVDSTTSSTKSTLVKQVPVTATPTFNPVAGTYSSSQGVVISSTTSGATIYYTTDGSTPNTGSPVYSGPISVPVSTTIKAYAQTPGWTDSAVASATYTINAVAAPTISPGTGTYTSAQSVTLACVTSNATIYYTTDGSTPTSSSTQFSTPIAVAANTVVKAFAKAAGLSDSPMASATFSIQAAAPAFSPAAGMYTSAQAVTLASSTPGATIYYTTDGSTPRTSSPVYSAPLNLTATATVNAFAAAAGLVNSAVAGATYTIQAATPALSPSPGTYASTQTVTISCATPGATIYYTADGSTPTTASTKYTVPFAVSATTTVIALATAPGMNNSAVAGGTYTLEVATPALSPAPGTYAGAQTVTISCATPGATIYYTTDGSVPSTASSKYTAPLGIPASATVNAIAAAAGLANSAMSSATYTIVLPVVATPAFSPVAGTYPNAQSVSLSSATPGATIYYTTDGSTPSTSSAKYTAAFSVPANSTINAYATAPGLADSPVATAVYGIQAATPTFSAPTGTYNSTQLVGLSCATAGAAIYYTTDGSTPTTSSTKYTSALTIATTTTVNALATATGMAASLVGSATYTLQAVTPIFSVAPGTYNSTQLVGLSCATAGAAIYYTTDGSAPTGSSTKYTSSLSISTTTIINALAMGPGLADSAVASATYTINLPPSITSALSATCGVGNAFTYNITATNNPASYGAIGLPSWAGLNSSTGAITGTPDKAGNSSVAISATNAGGTASAVLQLSIAATAPAITSALSASGGVGNTFTYNITAANSPASYGAIGLPSWAGLDSSTGAITGMPDKAGNSSVAISATNAGGTASAVLQLSIAATAPAITSPLNATGTVNIPFSCTISATGDSPIAFSAQPLPAGLCLNGTAISGTPTTAGQTSITLGASNGAGSDSQTLLLTINPPGSAAITSALTASALVNQPFSYQITASGTVPLAFNAANLPAWLSLSGDTLSGTPEDLGKLAVTLSATNSLGTDTEVLVVTVSSTGAPAITSSLAASGKAGQPFSYQIQATNNPASFQANPLPAWLSLSGSTLSGTPETSVVGAFKTVLTAANPAGTDRETLVITITPAVSDPPVVTDIYRSRNPVRTNTDITFTANAVSPSGCPLTYSWFFFTSSNAQDGPPLGGKTVKRQFPLQDLYTVVAIAFDGFTKSTNFTKVSVTLAPNSGSDAKSLLTGLQAANPVTGLGLAVPGSLGGVLDFDVVDTAAGSAGVSPAGVGKSRGGETLMTRCTAMADAYDGLNLAWKFSKPSIFVMETTGTQANGEARSGRLMVPVSNREAGITDSITDQRKNTGLTSFQLKGKFNFGPKPDSVTLVCTVELPAGLTVSQSLPVAVGIGNVTGSASVDPKGKVTDLTSAGSGAIPISNPIKKLQFKWPRLDKKNPVTKTGDTATLAITLTGSSLHTAGFDTEGIVNTVATGKKGVDRNIQTAIVIGGVSYYAQAKATYVYNKGTGQLLGRAQK